MHSILFIYILYLCMPTKCIFFWQIKQCEQEMYWLRIFSRREKLAKVGTCTHDRRALKELALNVHVKHSDPDPDPDPGFASRYWIQPRTRPTSPIGRCKAIIRPSLTLTCNKNY